jgi:hypothetical protein
MPLHFGPVDKVSVRPAALKETLKKRFQGLYDQLDEIDSPLEDSNNNNNNNNNNVQNSDKEVRVITPITAANQALIIQTAYRKRALAFLHGAAIAAQYLISDDECRKFLTSVSAIWEHVDAAMSHDSNPETLLTRLHDYLNEIRGVCDKYDLTYKDLIAGERMSSFERSRPKVYKSKYGQSEIIEKPLPAFMTSPPIAHQYEFITERTPFEKQKDPIPEKAPQWFKDQNRVVQHYLAEHAEEDLPCITPAHRSIPGMANMSLHEGTFKGRYPVKNKVIRHGTLTPYDIDVNERAHAARNNGSVLAHIISEKANENYRVFWGDDFLKTQKKPRYIAVADIGLVSPIQGEGILGAGDRAFGRDIYHERHTGSESNRAFKKENEDAYLEGIAHENAYLRGGDDLDALPINLGINGDREAASKTFRSEQYQKQVDETLTKFSKVQTYVKNYKSNRRLGEDEIRPFRDGEALNKYKMAVQAAGQLKSIVSIFKSTRFHFAFLTQDRNQSLQNTTLSRAINAELFANCLYAIVIEGMGGTVSACCKSSKDRTGLFLLHLDSMHEFFAREGRLPAFDADEDSKDRVLFVDILSDLYLENTQQFMANVVTSGAMGLKPPKGAIDEVHKYHLAPSGMDCWPPDVLKAIDKKCKNLFEQQCDLAATNKVKPKILDNRLEGLNKVKLSQNQ